MTSINKIQINGEDVLINGTIFDISEYNSTTNIPQTYNSLYEALGANGVNVPECVRKGGMSIKYIQSSNNKYIQWRLLKQSWSTIIGDWQQEDSIITKELLRSYNGAKCSDFSYNIGYVTYRSTDFKKNAPRVIESRNINIPIHLLSKYVQISNFDYTPLPGTLDVYTKLIFFDKNEVKISDISVSTNGVMSLTVPDNAAECYFSAPVAHIDNLIVKSFDDDNINQNITTLNNNVDSIIDGLQIDLIDTYTFNSVSDFDRGSIQPNGEVVINVENLVTPNWLLVRPNTTISIDFPETILYDNNTYTLEFRFVVNATKNINANTCKMIIDRGYHIKPGAVISIPSGEYHYFKFSVYLYDKASLTVVSPDVAEIVWNSLESLPITITLNGLVMNEDYSIKDINIITLNNKDLTRRRFEQLNRTVKGGNSTINSPNLILAHFSDIHQSRNNLARIKEYCTYWNEYIDDILCTGDSIANAFNQTSDSVWKTFWSGSDDILYCIGNHDTANYTSESGYVWDAHAGSDAYARFFEPYISNWNVIHDGNTSHCYYYKDYISQNVRLIVIDIMGWDSVQLSWFNEILNTAITSGLQVIVASHYTTNIETIECPFTSMFSATTSDLIPDDAITAVDNFINNDGVFITWLTGHVHRDYIGVISGHTNQTIVAVNTANGNGPKGQTQFDNIERIVDTKSFDLFNIISIDTYNKRFSMFRVGADIDMMLRHIDTICYDYNNKKLLY